MAQPTQLTPTEQDALVKQIGLAMLRVAPGDWEQLTVDYRAVGRYAEATSRVTYSDGTSESWDMPADLRGLFARLRGGMYREGRGTWFNARYRLDHPSSYNLEYDREEPSWDAPPPPQAYPDDMRLFPRSEENVPEWLRRRLAAAGPVGPPPVPLGGPPPGTPGADRPLVGGPGGPRFRVARIFDGPGEDGRPSVNRPQVDEMDLGELLSYLDGAPLVGPARGYDVDRLDPSGKQSVPVAFHTDGTWIWPAAVNYYLREHDISPEQDLIEHIRRMRFTTPQVDEQTRAAAQQFLGPPPRPPAPAPTRAIPTPGPAAPPPPAPVPPAPAQAGPPRAALPSQGPPAQQIEHLRARLEDLDVPETAYRIGQPTSRGWAMEQTDDGWRVGWYDHDWVAPAIFEDVADASAFLLGKLMLDTDRWAAGPKNPELPPQDDRGDRGFEPLSAPVEAFEPPPPRPVGPPPGTPGYTSPGTRSFSDAPDYADSVELSEPAGFGERPAEPARASYDSPFVKPNSLFDDSPNRPYADSNGNRAGTHGFSEPAESSSAFTPPKHQPSTMAMEPPSPPRGFESPVRGGDHGMDSPPRGFEAPPKHQPSTMAMEPPSPPRGFESPVRDGFEAPPKHQPSTMAMEAPSPPRGFESPVRGGDHGVDAPPRGLESPGQGLARPTNGAAAAPAGSEWPISPLPGEPPLTLFRGKRVIELEPGTEIDRYGDDDGNLVYVAGTPFAERSLVPEWIDRPYHAYRVRQPVQALTGAAIPWFDQPGGGTAYLLPDAIGELVAHGHLVELGDRERPKV